MKTIIRNKIFYLGFIVGVAIVSISNYTSYAHNVCSAGLDDCGWSFGFPFPMYSVGGFVSYKDINWLGLIADILFTLTISHYLSLLFKFVAFKISSRQNTINTG